MLNASSHTIRQYSGIKKAYKQNSEFYKHCFGHYKKIRQLKTYISLQIFSLFPVIHFNPPDFSRMLRLIFPGWEQYACFLFACYKLRKNKFQGL